MKYSVGALLETKELVLSLETELGEMNIGLLLAESYNGCYYVILREENGDYLETMSMDDETTKDQKIFKSFIGAAKAGTAMHITVTIVPEQRVWAVEVETA